MSVQPTNSSKYLEFHGIKLANGATIANFVVEKLAAAPATLEAGRNWYNTTTNKYEFVKYNGTELVVEAVATAGELAGLIDSFKSNLASTAAGKGTGLVGFVGQTGANGEFSVAAGTTEDTIKSIVNAADAEIKNRKDAIQASKTELSASTGAAKVGYEGKTGVNGVITVAAGTVKESIDSLVTQIDSELNSLGNDSLSKITLDDQTVASKVTFGGDIVIEGDISVLGERFIIEGNVVELGDNIILLNRDVLPDATPVADAGLQVNRGIQGTLDFIIWDESAKQTVAPSITIATEANVELGIEIGDEIVTMSRVVLGVEFDAFDTEVSSRLTTLEGQVNGKIGDLTTLVTEEKSNLVGAINELHADAVADRAALAASTGATLVGYAGKVGVNNLLTVAAGTVAASLDAIVVAIDAEAKATDVFILDLAATAAGKGSSLVGFAGQGVVGTDKFALAAGSVNASIGAITTAINEDRIAIEDAVASVADLKTAINAQGYKVVSASALTHTIVHGLNSTDIDVATWFKDGAVWVNHQAYTKIVDANTVELTLTTAAEVKVLVKKFEDLV